MRNYVVPQTFTEKPTSITFIQRTSLKYRCACTSWCCIRVHVHVCTSTFRLSSAIFLSGSITDYKSQAVLDLSVCQNTGTPRYLSFYTKSWSPTIFINSNLIFVCYMYNLNILFEVMFGVKLMIINNVIMTLSNMWTKLQCVFIDFDQVFLSIYSSNNTLWL